MKKYFKSFLFAFCVAVILSLTVLSSSAVEEDGKWISAWGTAPTQIGVKGYSNITPFVGKITSRSIITPTASGTKVRVRFSNHYGTTPLTLDTVTVAKVKNGESADIVKDTCRIVTFNGGNPSVTIPAGGEVLSDPIPFNVTALEEVAVSIYVENFSQIQTMGLSGSRSYLSVGKDETRSETMGISAAIDNPAVRELIKVFTGSYLDFKISYSFIKVTPCIATLDVYSDKDAYSVVVVGDSTVSNEYPQYLAEVIRSNGITNVGVVGKGIIGNRLGGEGLGYGALLFGESMIDRLTRDVISQSGVKYAIVKIGANDIMHPVCTDIQTQYPGIKQPTSAELIQDFKTAFTRLHNAGIKVIAVGITQWKGNDRDYLGTGAKYVRTEEEFEHDWQIALDVNEWFETTAAAEKYHDGYVYYNKISENPSDPEAFLPEYTIDGAHPSDELQKIWAKNFPLSLIGITSKVGSIRLDKGTASVNIGKSFKLNYTIIPEDAENQNVTWSSSNESVATVDSNGNVTAISGGKATISCTTEEGNYTAKCIVTVTVPVTGVHMNQSAATIYTTKTVKLGATVLPLTASNKALTWSSGNENVATVNASGVVTGVGSGTATIICRTKDGGYTDQCTITVKRKIEVENIELAKYSKTMWLGESFILSVAVLPSNATFKEMKYKSLNTKVATVDSNGVIKAVAPGTTYITVTSADNSFVTDRCKVTVKVKTTGVKLNKASLTLVQKNKQTLVPTVYPLNATNKNVVWSSSNSTVASVDKNGTVTAKKVGTAVITCKTESGGYTATCAVTVNKLVKTKSVSLNRLTATVYVSRELRLVATVLPENATSKAVTWKSSNKKIAKVDKNGVVTGVSKGTVTITCTTKDTGRSESCEVTVKNVKVKAVQLDKKSVSLFVNGTTTLKVNIVPSYATNKKVTWKSSNKKVATVNSKGKITAVGPGKATITCTSESGKCVAKCTVKVTTPKISKISFKKSQIELSLNKSTTLKPTIKPSGAKNAKVKWESSNTKVVKVNSKGKITAVGVGSAIITCKPADGGKGTGGFIVVKVTSNPVIGVKLNKSRVVTTVGDSFKLKATVLPEKASNKAVKWSSSDESVAKVNSKGVVKTVGKGRAYVRATTVDGNCVAICIVRVS